MRQTHHRLLAAAALSLLVLAAGASAQNLTPGPDAAGPSQRPADSVGGKLSGIVLPEMGEPADAALSPPQEEAIGNEIVGELYTHDYILDDGELAEYLASIGWRLIAAANVKPPRLDVFMVNDPRINAFALPGGHMGINAGLLLASSSESELAGVMGHELTHITQRHIARSANEGTSMSTLATWAAVLAAVIAGSANPDVVLAGLAIGQSVSLQNQLAFTRAAELEADRIGIQTMADAGFNPEGMATFFQRLEQQSRLYGAGLPEILQTHPMNTTRVAEARARIAAMKPRPFTDSIEYVLMQARTRVLITELPSESVDFYTAELKRRDTPANRYGLALALSRTGQNDKGMQALAPTFKQHPQQANVALLMAKLQLGTGKKDEALALYDKTLQQYPRYSPAILEYGAALIEAGKPEKARQIMLSYEQQPGTRNETYRLLSMAAKDAKNEAEASYQMATYLYHRGDPGGALVQLDAGLRLDGLAPTDRARLAARRAEVRESLPRNFNPYGNDRRGGR